MYESMYVLRFQSLDHYHFNYQKNRPLREERKILPGDSMTFGKLKKSYILCQYLVNLKCMCI
jgi:hypothetical protein